MDKKIREPGSPQPTWSLISVTFNSEAALRTHWASFRAPADVEWIVVDNASSDGSAILAAELGARVIRLEENVGFGGANNVGFHASLGQYVAFVNPDVSVVTEDLEVLRLALIRGPKDLVSPQLLHPSGELQPNGRGTPLLAHKVLNRFVPERLTGRYLFYAEPGEEKRVVWLMGAVVAGTRSHLEQLGPWDDHFFVYYEDSDLGLRNAQLGGESRIVGDARWVHGWARETIAPSRSAWQREIPSMVKFYSRYPRLLLPLDKRGKRG